MILLSMKMPENDSAKEFKKILKVLPKLDYENGPWVAGGAVRRILENKPIIEGDIDIFTKKCSDYALKNTNILDYFEKMSKNNIFTDNAHTYKINIDKKLYNIQVITRAKYSSLVELFHDFDITVCQLATDGENIYYFYEVLEHLKDKKLIINYKK